MRIGCFMKWPRRLGGIAVIESAAGWRAVVGKRDGNQLDLVVWHKAPQITNSDYQWSDQGGFAKPARGTLALSIDGASAAKVIDSASVGENLHPARLYAEGARLLLDTTVGEVTWMRLEVTTRQDRKP